MQRSVRPVESSDGATVRQKGDAKKKTVTTNKEKEENSAQNKVNKTKESQSQEGQNLIERKKRRDSVWLHDAAKLVSRKWAPKKNIGDTDNVFSLSLFSVVASGKINRDRQQNSRAK